MVTSVASSTSDSSPPEFSRASTLVLFADIKVSYQYGLNNFNLDCSYWNYFPEFVRTNDDKETRTRMRDNWICGVPQSRDKLTNFVR